MDSILESDQIASRAVSDDDSGLPESTDEVTDDGVDIGESSLDDDSALGDDS